MNCYITNPYAGAELPKELDKDNTLFYPEQGMTTHQKWTTSRPRDYHIVTDAPELVGLYDSEEVFIWKDGEWVNPRFQTYGTSVNLLVSKLFGTKHTIAHAVVSSELVTNCMGYPIK